jgi:outer membrane lipoprotein-sorting protein
MKKVGTQDQRGVAHLMLVILVVVVAGVIGGVAWRVISQQKDNKTNSSPTTAAGSVKEDKEVEKACLSAIKDKNLCKFASKSSFDFSNGVSYQALMTTTDKAGKKTVIDSSVDGKNNTSAVTKENGTALTSYVLLNNVMYTKNAGEATWTKYPATNDNSATQSSKPASDIEVDTKDFTGEKNTITYKALGKEKCGNLTCFKYQVIDKENPSDETFMWFDTKDYVIQRYSFKNAEGSNDIVFTYKSVKIKEPSPVKDFSAQSSADLEAAAAAANANASEE